MQAITLLVLLAINPPEPVTSDACLTCHHPTGHVYAVAYAGHNLRPPTDPSGFGGTVASDFLVEGRIECTSCHHPHGMPAGANRLRFETAQFCTGCHVLE